MTPIRKVGGLVLIVVCVVAALIMVASNPVEHIEDTNGPEDYSLQIINDGNIEAMNYGARGFSSTTDNLTGYTTYSSKKYTGVTEVYGGTCLTGTYTLYVNYFEVREGNAKLVLTMDDKIVHEFEPNEIGQEFTVENARGNYFSIRLAGESASFKLDIS